MRIVELIRPLTIMLAIGPSISRPGSPLPTTSGSRPKPVTIAVINIDGSLSDAPFNVVEKFQGSFSTSTKC